jgi:nucleoside-diphosphate-sugar epimerase
MKIFITGIGGFLGRSLAAHLTGRGHDVTGSKRTEMAIGGSFDRAVFTDMDCVIYCAHDFARGARRKNVEGTRAWFSAAVLQGVQRQVFLSSYSAGPDADAEYGRTKYEIERIFLESGQTVLRPGLVLGDGGLFHRQRTALLRTPIVPLIGAGMQPLAIIDLQCFLDAVAVVIEDERTGAFNLFYEKQPAYREFVRDLKSAAGQRTRFLSIPAPLALALARLAELLHLPIPVSPGQIRGLLKNSQAAWQSDLRALLDKLSDNDKKL